MAAGVPYTISILTGLERPIFEGEPVGFHHPRSRCGDAVRELDAPSELVHFLFRGGCCCVTTPGHVAIYRYRPEAFQSTMLRVGIYRPKPFGPSHALKGRLTDVVMLYFIFKGEMKCSA